MQATIYTRVSQDRTGESAAVERQETECRGLCQRLGWDVVEVFSDNDTSATSGAARPGFEALLASKPAVVVAWHQDRLLRLTSDLERVIRLDVPVYTVRAGTLDLTNPAGRAVARTVAAWSTYETEQKAERQKSANRQRALAGKPTWGTRRPFGFELDGTLRESEAALIRKAYADILDGASLGTIRREWNGAGVPTSLGNKWATSTIRDLLRRPSNAGLVQYQGEILDGVQGQWTPIVDVATWEACRAVLDAPERRQTHATVRTRELTGVAVCGLCEVTVNGSWTITRKGAHVRQYRCPTSHMQRSAEPIEAAVQGATFRVLSLGGARHVLTERGDDTDTAALRAERATLTARRDNDIAEGLATGLLTPVQAANATAAIDERLRVINSELLDAQRGGVFDGVFTSYDDEEAHFRAVWPHLPLHQRQGILTTLWERIEIPKGRVPVLLKPSALTARIIAAQGGRDAWEWVSRA